MRFITVPYTEKQMIWLMDVYLAWSLVRSMYTKITERDILYLDGIVYSLISDAPKN